MPDGVGSGSAARAGAVSAGRVAAGITGGVGGEAAAVRVAAMAAVASGLVAGMGVGDDGGVRVAAAVGSVWMMGWANAPDWLVGSMGGGRPGSAAGEGAHAARSTMKTPRPRTATSQPALPARPNLLVLCPSCVTILLVRIAKGDTSVKGAIFQSNRLS